MRNAVSRGVLLTLLLLGCDSRESRAGDAALVNCEHPNHPGVRACCGRPGEFAGANCVPWSVLDQACVAEGDLGHPKIFQRCCDGLKEVPTIEPAIDASVDAGYCTPPHPSLVFRCARCGNGECGRGENSCSCPVDCP
jgi:hypothetical protein